MLIVNYQCFILSYSPEYGVEINGFFSINKVQPESNSSGVAIGATSPGLRSQELGAPEPVVATFRVEEGQKRSRLCVPRCLPAADQLAVHFRKACTAQTHHNHCNKCQQIFHRAVFKVRILSVEQNPHQKFYPTKNTISTNLIKQCPINRCPKPLILPLKVQASVGERACLK